MEHNSSRVAQTAKKFPSLYETLQVISFQYHPPTTSFLRHITHIHTLNSYFFKILISIILQSSLCFSISHFLSDFQIRFWVYSLCHLHVTPISFFVYFVSVTIFREFLIRLASCIFISSVLGQNIFFRILILVSNAHYLRANINTNRFEFQGILIRKVVNLVN